MSEHIAQTAFVTVAVTSLFFLTAAQKVTWPSRRETAITTAMVFVMVTLASLFFLVGDQVVRLLVTFLLGIGG